MSGACSRSLTVAASARRRTVYALSFESDNDLGLYPYVRLEVRTEMLASLWSAVVARSAVKTRARCACETMPPRFGVLSAVVPGQVCVFCHGLRRFGCPKSMYMRVV